ncbi:MAG TPA: asparagine synthase (glutamine-hydrolyzing) [Vicinamibacterales bacterium]|nr:asparagine synthase (glutamine-hydrolyzing) [Vicinamibacterales bacterium]
MCGICGVVALDGGLDPRLRASIDTMTATLHHRGPDGQGVRTDGTAAFGHRRLAIIDRATGAQPMTNEDGTCWIVFNGEIYNHRPLRRELEQRGHVFRTQSDTECIVHAYEEYGADCVSRLEGMFAFAVYDRVRRELFIARDRLGKKPLFYATFAGAFHFGSEIKALQASPAWDAEVDLSQLECYMSLGYVIAPETAYRHVKKLPAGHWLRASRRGVQVQRYWDVDRFDDHEGSGRALEEEISDTIRTAVRDRLESEVPLGAFLSGGIDSGLVVSYMAEALGPGVTTTSIGFGDADDELDAAALTASRFDTRHYAEVLRPDPESVIDRVVAGFDEPFADASAVPTFHVAAMAKRHVTVVLSGDGGDEAFGGYGFRYAPHAVESMVRAWLPARPGRAAAAWLGTRWPRSPRMPRALRWGTLLENIARDPASAYYSDLCLVKPHVARALLGLTPDRDPRRSAVYDTVTAPYRRCPSASPLQRAQYADLQIYLANDVLVKVDRMTMQHGIEVRAPLLDRRVIELAFRIPAHRKMPRLQSKHLLRQLARRRLPRALASLPKRGFSPPIGGWLTGPCAVRFRDDVLAPGAPVHGLLDARAVRRLFDDHVAGRADHSQALWSVWMLARWSGREREGARRHVQCVEVRS